VLPASISSDPCKQNWSSICFNHKKFAKFAPWDVLQRLLWIKYIFSVGTRGVNSKIVVGFRNFALWQILGDKGGIFKSYPRVPKPRIWLLRGWGRSLKVTLQTCAPTKFRCWWSSLTGMCTLDPPLGPHRCKRIFFLRLASNLVFKTLGMTGLKEENGHICRKAQFGATAQKCDKL
jgi:hypothetical protein